MNAKKLAIGFLGALLTAIAAAVVLDALKRRGIDPVGRISAILSPAPAAGQVVVPS